MQKYMHICIYTHLCAENGGKPDRAGSGERDLRRVYGVRKSAIGRLGSYLLFDMYLYSVPGCRLLRLPSVMRGASRVLQVLICT